MLDTTKKLIKRFAADESGASMVEYVVLLFLVIGIAAGAMTLFEGGLDDAYDNLANELRTNTGGAAE